MGKKSRMKRERLEAQAPISHIDAMVHAREDDEIQRLQQLLLVAREQEAEQKRHDRLNVLPMGHPDNEYKLAMTFEPIERWLEHFRATGEYEAIKGGVAIFQPHGGEEWYPIVESFMAVCDTYELIARDAGVPDETGPMRRLANKIHYDMPVNSSEITAVKKTIEWMKDITRPLTPTQFSDYSIAIQIRATMAERKRA